MSLIGIAILLIGVAGIAVGAFLYFTENALDAAGGTPALGMTLAALPLAIGIAFTVIGSALLALDRN